MKTIDAETVRRLASDLRDLEITDERAAQLATEVARVNEAARAEGAKNDFNDEPSRYAVTLTALAKR